MFLSSWQGALRTGLVLAAWVAWLPILYWAATRRLEFSTRMIEISKRWGWRILGTLILLFGCVVVISRLSGHLMRDASLTSQVLGISLLAATQIALDVLAYAAYVAGHMPGWEQIVNVWPRRWKH